MSRKIDDLDPRMKAKAIELLARCVEAGIHVVIVDTLRTPAEHAKNLRKGVSWVKHSKHLDGLAIDLCPIKSFMGPGTTKLNWNDVGGDWQKIGLLGESLGLRWGGRWKKRDLGHFELP